MLWSRIKTLVLIGSLVLAAITLDRAGFAKVPQLGDRAPSFSLESIQGGKINMADHLGADVIVLGLFHICEPCMFQAMEMDALRTSLKSEGVVFVGVNAAGDAKAAVLDYLNGFPKKVGFPYLLDPNKTVERLFSIRATPIVYIIDRQGVIRFRGSSVPAGVLKKELEKLL
jgi:cytochrome c biogenesis protein CcmG, thiol:disulfide interchange protein DsbE